MQELLERCDIKAACAMQGTRMSEGASTYRKWIALPENVQEVVTPFLTSRYLVQQMEPVMVEYPIFRPGRSYGNWLRSFVIDMLRKGQNSYADMVFEPLTRVIRVKDLSTAEFLLPYLALHVLLGSRSTQKEKDNVLGEMLGILQHQPREDAPHQVKEDSKRFCHVSIMHE
jgi:serine/threonine-protein kinase ATR